MAKKEPDIIQKVVEISRKDPKYFIKAMWGLSPQERGKQFLKGSHYTWQQNEILEAVKKAVTGKGHKRISVRSGHGIGKSATLSWLIIWYLFCFKDSQIPCTAPTSVQMHDVLWKEVSKWLERLPDPVKKKFETTTEYIRIVDSPDTWFARAATARKETPEALAGMHADNLMYVVDEASGVPDEIFNTAEGSLTGTDIVFIMISNATRNYGYFFDSHHKDKKNWQTLHFSSMESPIVDEQYVNRIAEKNGTDSDEYLIRVLGEFPKMNTMDDEGWVPMLEEAELKFVPDANFIGETRMGVDPAGEGKDKTTWVVRDSFKARIVAEEKISNESSIAQKTLTLMTHYNVPEKNIFIDNFGIGANISKELALSSLRVNSYPINVGEKAKDSDKFMNVRAEAYYRLKQWLRKGGELVNHAGWDELLHLFYRRELSGKMQIMGKRKMKKMGISSPDFADALMLTFTKPEYSSARRQTPAPREPTNKYTGY